MKLAVEVSSKVTHDGTTYLNLSEFLAARKVLGASRLKFIGSNQSLSAAINSAYTKTGMLLDELVADAIGASSVVGTQGHGVIFDNIAISSDGKVTMSENKLVSSIVSSSGMVQSVSKISVAGAQGLTLSAGKRSFFVNDSFNIDMVSKAPGELADKVDVSKALSTVEVSITKDFINNLLMHKNDQGALKKLINANRSAAAVALRKNFELKSSDIRVLLDVNGKTVVRAIGWTWDDIMKDPRASISVKDLGRGKVNFNIYFSEGLVKEALNKVSTVINQKEIDISQKLAQSLAQQFAAFSPDVQAYLSSFSIKLTHKYDQGSLLVGKGSISDNSKIKKLKTETQQTQRFISGAQWTMLVHKKLGDTMSRVGPPAKPNLKERTGRFRHSVNLTVNYRKKMLQYSYNPLYSVLEQYGYTPEKQIERAIRSVAQELYNTHFSIIRR